MKSSLKLVVVFELFKGVVGLNTFTLHFPNVNVLQSTQSSLKWSLLWKEVFSETRGCLRTLGMRGWLWIHSLFISRSKTFSKVPNLLWNKVVSEMKSSLKLCAVFELFEGVVGFEYIHSSFPERRRSTEYAIFSEMKSYLKWILLWNSWSSLNSLKAWSSLNC